MLKLINNLFDYIRSWKYIETKYKPTDSLAYRGSGSTKFFVNQHERGNQLEEIYEWNYDNLRGVWKHISKPTKKGPLCQEVNRNFFVFKREEDIVAFKLKWGE